MEAAGSLAPVYPKVFSGRMVPRLGEELQSGRAGGGKGMILVLGCSREVVPHGTGPWLSLLGNSQHNVVLAPGGLWLGTAAGTALEELPSYGREPLAWLGVVLCFCTPFTLVQAGP